MKPFQDAVPLGGFLIVGVIVASWAVLLFVPQKPLPAEAGNGTYASPCCAALTLRDGHGQSADVEFDYVVEPGKAGPRVLLSRQALIVADGRLVLVEAKSGQFLHLAPSTPPTWLDVDGNRFSRMASSNDR